MTTDIAACGLYDPDMDTTASLGEHLDRVIDGLPPDQVTLVEIRDGVGADGLLIFVILLTLVFMVPVSIPGVSTIFGAAIVLVGVSRLLGRALWLPEPILRRSFPSDGVRAALRKGAVWSRRLERVSRPHRWPALASGPVAERASDAALTFAAILLMAPFGMVPFSNTLPALAILFYSIGLLQRDGAAVLLGHLTNLLTVVYFSMLLAGGGALVLGAWRIWNGGPG